MSSGDEIPSIPAPPDEGGGPRVGVDTWVAEMEERHERESGLVGLAKRAWFSSPVATRLAFFAVLAATLPLYLNRADIFTFGIITLLYAILGLGLNVVIGFAGLLDLGYVAFYGFGAYVYSFLSSSHTESGYHYSFHWPAEATIPVVVVASALLGLLLGLPSRRLLGDYLAIVTLFFGQAFVVFVNTADPRGLTGGSNGLPDVDPLTFFGYALTTRTQYFYFLLGVLVVILVALHFLSESRTGRAWRALREDPLAAELMGMPVKRLKLLAFAFGAAIAGLAGSIFAAVVTGAFPGSFDVSVLITIYAIVILGGLGSLTGVLLGAIVINVSFQFLAPESPQGRARLLFYGVIVLLVLLKMRPWRRLALVVGGTLAFGLALHAIVEATAPSWTAGSVVDGGFLKDAIGNWALIPLGHGQFGTYSYVGLIAAILVVTRLRGWWRTIGLIPTLYLVALVWENILVEQPSVTRLILFGALLIGLMNARPQGLLGTARVEIV